MISTKGITRKISFWNQKSLQMDHFQKMSSCLLVEQNNHLQLNIYKMDCIDLMFSIQLG